MAFRIVGSATSPETSISLSTSPLPPEELIEDLWDYFHTMPLYECDRSPRFWRSFDEKSLALEWPLLPQRSPEPIRRAPSPEVEQTRFALQKSVPEEKQWKCPISGCWSSQKAKATSFTRRHELKKHLIKKHSPLDSRIIELFFKQPRFPCPVAGCTSGFSRKNDLNQHLKKKHLD